MRRLRDLGFGGWSALVVGAVAVGFATLQFAIKGWQDVWVNLGFAVTILVIGTLPSIWTVMERHSRHETYNELKGLVQTRSHRAAESRVEEVILQLLDAEVLFRLPPILGLLETRRAYRGRRMAANIVLSPVELARAADATEPPPGVGALADYLRSTLPDLIRYSQFAKGIAVYQPPLLRDVRWDRSAVSQRGRRIARAVNDPLLTERFLSEVCGIVPNPASETYFALHESAEFRDFILAERHVRRGICLLGYDEGDAEEANDRLTRVVTLDTATLRRLVPSTADLSRICASRDAARRRLGLRSADMHVLDPVTRETGPPPGAAVDSGKANADEGEGAEDGCWRRDQERLRSFLETNLDVVSGVMRRGVFLTSEPAWSDHWALLQDFDDRIEESGREALYSVVNVLIDRAFHGCCEGAYQRRRVPSCEASVSSEGRATASPVAPPQGKPAMDDPRDDAAIEDNLPDTSTLDMSSQDESPISSAPPPPLVIMKVTGSGRTTKPLGKSLEGYKLPAGFLKAPKVPVTGVGAEVVLEVAHVDQELVTLAPDSRLTGKDACDVVLLMAFDSYSISTNAVLKEIERRDRHASTPRHRVIALICLFSIAEDLGVVPASAQFDVIPLYRVAGRDLPGDVQPLDRLDDLAALRPWLAGILRAS